MRHNRNRTILAELLCGFFILFIFFVVNVVRNTNEEAASDDIRTEQNQLKSAFCMKNENGRAVFFYHGNTLTMSLKPSQISSSVVGEPVQLYYDDGKLRQVRGCEKEYYGSILEETDDSIMILNGGEKTELKKSSDFQIFQKDKKMTTVENYAEPIMTSSPVTFYTNGGQAYAGVLENNGEEMIRILLSTTGHEGYLHERVELSCDEKFTMKNGKRHTSYDANQRVTIEAGNSMFSNGTIQMVPKNNGRFTIYSIKRAQGILKVNGNLELSKSGDGILLVNELPFETYLCGVVNSEMPEEYGEEALKAQAVCARSYAYHAMKERRFIAYGADLDDTTMSQVYLEQPQKKSAQIAVKSTRGQILWKDDKALEAFYYASSQDKMEKTSPWYHWQITFERKSLEDSLKKKIELLDEQGKVQPSGIERSRMTSQMLQVQKQNEKGQVTELVVTFEQDPAQSYLITGEYEIRKLLSPDGQLLLRQDGSRITDCSLLPSAFFEILEEEDEITIKGSGYGHGNGMSQYGAKVLAEKGFDYLQILGYYFPGGSLKIID